MNKNHFFYTYIIQKLIFFLSFVAFFSSDELNAQTLVWQEEFNSTSLDGNLWTYDFGDGCDRNLCGWGNAELQCYTSRPENVRVENGNLIIEARNENFGNRAFTSGRIKSEGRFHFKYGTLEARIKIPNLANGIWPAFWTLGTIGGTWPSIGEIDVMEMGNQSARLAGVINMQVTSAVHYSNNGSYSSTGSSINSTVNLNNDYHLYKLVWNAQTVNMYLDNVLFNTFDISNPSNTSKEEFHQPHFILLNMAIGGAYTGLLNNSDITATMPAQMLVDYIRLYQNPGDVVNYGTQNITSGNWGVFTETTSVTSNLTLGQNATFYTWNNLSSINSATPFEGSNVWAYRANAGNWFGMGLENNYINLSGHMSGSLKFHFKTSYSGQFKFGIKTAHGESWVNVPAGSTAYGIIRDGNWHEVSIPLTEFDNPALGRNFDNMSVKSAFMFAGDAPASNADFYFDNIYFSKNTVSPTLGSFSVPAKTLGQAPFTLTAPSSNSTGVFSYSSSNTSVATISGNTVTIVGVGTSVITATQSASSNFGSASVTANLVVTMPVLTTAAPTPPLRNANDYVSLYSNAYTNVSGIDWNPIWGQSTVVTEVNLSSNATRKYDHFNYQGVQFSGAVNASAMQYLHIDVWTPNCNPFDVYLINTSPSLVEQKVSLTPTFLGWNSFDIPLTQYNTIALSNIHQLKFVGTPFGTSVVYYDNLYFWRPSNTPALSNFSVPAKNMGDATFVITPPTSNSTGSFTYTSSNTAVATISGNTITIIGVGSSTITAIQAAAGSYSTGSITTTFTVNFAGPTSAAPVPPVRGSSDYLSIYSDAYTNMSGTDFNPFWGQSTVVTDYPVAGNNHKKYDLFNYQGIQLAAVADVSGMQYVHIDIWTPNCSSFDLYLINTTPSLLERKVTITPVLNGWNSYDFPLSQFSPVAMNNISQFKLMGTPSGTSIVYWDNLYFWKAAATTTPVVSVVQPNCSIATGTITVTSSTVGLSFSIDGTNYNNTTGIFTGLTPGNYSLTAKNSTGTISLAVAVNIQTQPTLPSTPAVINGIKNINKCDTLQLYSVASVPGLTYNWTVTGTGNYIRSGQGNSTVSIVLKVAGTITVKAVNSCGTSPTTSYAITKTAPASPSGIFARFNGSIGVAADVNLCKYTQSAFASTGIKDTFRIRTIAFATGYYFQVPGGASMSRLNDTTIAVVFADTTSTGATIKAYSLSACDTSLAKVLTLTRGVAAAPNGIYTSFNANSTSGPTAVTSVCSLVGGGSSTYMIRKVATAQSYIWSLRRGTNASLTRLAIADINDTSYRVTFATGFTKDTLEVKSVNGCGVSVAKTVIMNATLAPPAVTAVTASTGNFTPCIGNSVQYTATATLPTTSQSAIAVYRWTKPNFTTITGATADSASITLHYDAGFTGGVITAKGQSNCGIAGSVKSVTLLYLPPTPIAITSSTGVYNFCFGSSATFTAAVPSPSTSQRAAVVYRWTKPNNTVIVSAASDSSSITLQFNTGFTGGAVTVKGQTACGAQGSAKSQSITHTGCPAGTKLIAVNEKDLNDLQSNVYPSPSNGNFTVNIATGIEQSGPAQIQLIDMYGKVMDQYSATNIAGRIVRSISNNKLVEGMYLLKITCGSWNKTERVVVGRDVK